MSNARRDNNRVTTIIGVSSADLTTPTLIAVNPTTGAVLIDSASIVTGLDTIYLRLDTANKPLTGNLSIGTTQFLNTNGSAVLNEIGAAVVIRFEGDTDQNLFYLNGATDKIGFGTTTPAEKLNVIGNFEVDDNATPTKGYRFRTTGSSLDLDASNADLLISNYSGAGFTGTQMQYMRFGAGSAFVTVANGWEWKTGNNVFGGTQHSINSDAGVVFNETGGAFDTRIEGDTDQNLLFVQGSTDRVGIGTNAPGSRLDVNGSFQCNTITNDTGLAAGVYTPTRSAETNLDANVTMTEAQYMRVGNTVTVSGRFTADPTVATSATSFEITLPVASNIGAAEDIAGVAFCGNIASMGAEVIGVAANDTAKIQWKATDITSQTWSYTFTYQVI